MLHCAGVAVDLSGQLCLQVRKAGVVQRARAGCAVRVSGRRRARRGDVREPHFVAGDAVVFLCDAVKRRHLLCSFLVFRRVLKVIALQTYVGDWGEELLEGRVDVADFFD